MRKINFDAIVGLFVLTGFLANFGGVFPYPAGKDQDIKTILVCGTLTNFCCESTARTGYFLNYHVVFGSDVNATDNAMAHNATIRTMRRGFARVMDHRTIIDLLRNGDYMYKEAREQRERSRSVPRPDPIGSR